MESIVKAYLNYTAVDFAQDGYFQSWVLYPDESSDAFWRTLISEHPEKATAIEEAKEILLSIGAKRYHLSQLEMTRLWTRIQQENDPTYKVSSLRKYRWYAAAAAVLLIGVSLAIVSRLSSPLEYKTQYGQTRTIILPDSSTVILNANSRISFDRDWGNRPVREIWLEGEAYFSVVHKKNHQPFKVRTAGDVAVEVLGTSFTVYHRHVDTKVVLKTGQIRLSLPVNKVEKKILMKPGELVELKRNQLSRRVVNPGIHAAWTEKKIILDQTSLRDIIRMAKDNYGVDILVQSPEMLTQTMSGSMPMADAESFINQVARVFQLKVVEQNGKYLFIE